MHEVPLTTRSPLDLTGIVAPDRLSRLLDVVAPGMRERLDGAGLVQVNSTATGGGVAEMLQVLLPLARGAGIDARWLVLDGEPEFYAITKRLHHRLHGSAGDGGPLGAAEHAVMERVAAANAGPLLDAATSGVPLVLHDPQPAPLAAALVGAGVPVVWRCHVGVDFRNEHTEQAWEFLRPYLEATASRFVFTREQYAPDWVPRERLDVIKPSIDPLAAKNRVLDPQVIAGALMRAGLITGSASEVTFERADGSVGSVVHAAEITREGPAPDPQTPLVVQVSRWDPLKDMAGVMTGFVERALDTTDAHLVLAGPSVAAVTDDPEGALVLREVTAAWHDLPVEARRRVSLVCLPMDDVEENAILVNALQRHAAVVAQKSHAEGFGLTVTEALYKGRPVVASAVGGIVDQITDDVDGLLVRDSHDLVAFGDLLVRVLEDANLATRLGSAAHARAVDAFLPDTSLTAWAGVLTRV